MKASGLRAGRILPAVAACVSLLQVIALPGSRAQSWREMSPAERLEALRNYERHRKAPPEKRREVEERYRRWRKLPAEERERLRRRFEEGRSRAPTRTRSPRAR